MFKHAVRFTVLSFVLVATAITFMGLNSITKTSAPVNKTSSSTNKSSSPAKAPTVQSESEQSDSSLISIDQKKPATAELAAG